MLKKTKENVCSLIKATEPVISNARTSRTRSKKKSHLFFCQDEDKKAPTYFRLLLDRRILSSIRFHNGTIEFRSVNISVEHGK